MFQSHAGSIEALQSFREAPCRLQFQSHAGSIEAVAAAAIGRLVRGFNPTLVRLRRGDRGGVGGGGGGFQSHAGSIEAPRRCSSGVPTLRFNPTLVRLRPVKTMERKPRPESFNPTLVRLRHPRCRTILVDQFPSFNPTLVRLRHGVGVGWSGRGGVSIPRWFD